MIPISKVFLCQYQDNIVLCKDNKWSVYELWAWLRERGQDPEPFWSRVKDVVIKTILCGHKNIDNMVKKSVGSFYNNFNLLGLDIFIDTDYKWASNHNSFLKISCPDLIFWK